MLRPRLWVVSLVLLAETAFIAGAVFSYDDSGWTLTSLAFAGLSLLGGVALAEVASTRIVLSETTLEAGSVLSRHRYPVADIASVTWQGGAGVAVKLSNGGWAKLPDLGYNSQGLANTLRAWLERVRAADE